MSVRVADSDQRHLYPEFRNRLRKVLDEVSDRTGAAWRITEGYRSPERQLWLYAQGRTRPGRIVTWMRTPKYHGTGLAADVIPTKLGYNAPMSWWQALRDVYHGHGLTNPAWGKGDLGHVQLSDPTVRARALEWVRAGFPESQAPVPHSDIQVLVNGIAVQDAGGFLGVGRCFVALRPVTDALDWTIAEVADGKATVLNDERELSVPLVIRMGRGYAAVRELEPLAQAVRWDPGSRRVFIDE